MGEKVVLSYHDSLLKESDVNLLDDGQWINDSLIGFVFEYLSNDMFKDISGKIGFISPEVVQFIKLAEVGDIDVFLGPLQLQEKELVFCPINDNAMSDAAGGSHWSLLVYKREGKLFSHYDSLAGSNQRHARAVYKKIKLHLTGQDNKEKHMEVNCCQQSNSYDCGMYVICFTEHLCRSYALQQKVTSIQISSEDIKRRRRSLKGLIHSLKNR